MSALDNVLTIIPARGGSVSVPKKNIFPMSGKPLIQWIAEAALSSKKAGRIIVSTDDTEIAEIARSIGLEVPFLRPKNISGPLSTDLEFCIHALNFFKEHEGWIPDAVARFSPSTPFVTSTTITDSISKLLGNENFDSLRPVSLLSHHPYKAWLKDGNILKPAFDKSIVGYDQPHNLPRQLFPEMFAHLGASGVAWTNTILNQQSTSGNRVGFFEIDPMEAFDINSLADIKLAEAILSISKDL